MLALVALACAGCSHHARKPLGEHGVLLRIDSGPSVVGGNGSRLAWIGSHGVVVVDDVLSGEKTVLGNWPADAQPAIAVSGRSVLWTDIRGGLERKDTLRAASPTRHIRIASWWEGDIRRGNDSPVGGIAADGRTLVYALAFLSTLNPEACFEKGDCRSRISGGGTVRLTPGSLARRRILPPALAVAVDGDDVAAAIVRRGALFSGKSQIVVANLATGVRRLVGKPAPVQRLMLDGRYVAAALGGPYVVHPVCRIWDVATGKVVGTIRHLCDTGVLAGTRLIVRATRGRIVAVDARTQRQQFVARATGFVVWMSVRGRDVLWAERHGDFPNEYTLVRSAPLPPRR